MKTVSLMMVATIFVLLSCNKEKISEEITCENIQNITLLSNSPVKIGEMIRFGTQEVGGYRVYDWHGPNNYWGQTPIDSIIADKKNQGWYYLRLTTPDGKCQKIDSMYIEVKLEQGEPPCNVSTNSTIYNNLPADNFTIVTKGIERSFSQKALSGSGGIFSEITVYFHTHWRSLEPEDGIYTTINSPLFDQADNSYNKVNIALTKSSIYWTSYEGQSIYVSHVGSKLQVQFCNLEMGGNNGTSYRTMASGNIVEK